MTPDKELTTSDYVTILGIITDLEREKSEMAQSIKEDIEYIEYLSDLKKRLRYKIISMVE